MQEKITVVHWGSQQNPYLSNFAILPVKIQHGNHSFWCIEAAYHAYKSGSYIDGFEELNGRDAWQLSRRLRIKRSWKPNYTDILMWQLLLERRQIDPRFREELLAAGKIVHPVTDVYWSQKFPYFLEQIKLMLQLEQADQIVYGGKEQRGK